jgi:hypothetical protein
VPFSSITPSVTDWYHLRDLILNPGYVFSTVFELASTGFYTIFSWQPTGFWLYLFWIIEACIVIFCAVGLATLETKKPFSEKLNKWYPNKVYTIGFLHDINQFVQALNAQDFNALSSLQSTHADQDHALLTLYYLPNDEAFISISNQDRKVNEKGKFETKSTEIVEYYKITAAQAEQLQKQLI